MVSTYTTVRSDIFEALVEPCPWHYLPGPTSSVVDDSYSRGYQNQICERIFVVDDLFVRVWIKSSRSVSAVPDAASAKWTLMWSELFVHPY